MSWRLVKRVLDLVLVLFGLAVLWPVFIVASVLILLFDGRPIFFRQTRVGRLGRPFTLLKFRTMKNGPAGSLITVGGDSRITPVGAFLRKTKLDELPQLLNVLAGQMSFVGPRPEVKKYVSMYSSEQEKVLQLSPGITDPASLIYFDESEVLASKTDPEQFYIQTLMPEKIRVNLQYANVANPASDLWIIVVTVLRVLGIRVNFMTELQSKSHDKV